VKTSREVTLDDFLREVLRWQTKWLQDRVRRSYSLKAKYRGIFVGFEAEKIYKRNRRTRRSYSLKGKLSEK
jgi:hypothetical protein